MISKSARRVKVTDVAEGTYEARIFVCREPQNVAKAGYDHGDRHIQVGKVGRHSSPAHVSSSFNLWEQTCSSRKAGTIMSKVRKHRDGYNYWDFYVNITNQFERLNAVCDIDGSGEVGYDEASYLFENELGASDELLHKLKEFCVKDPTTGELVLSSEDFCCCIAHHLRGNVKTFYERQLSQISNFWDKVSDSSAFIWTANIAILVAALTDTLGTYPALRNDKQSNDILYWISFICLVIFTIESFVKFARVKFQPGLFLVGTPGTPKQYGVLLFNIFTFHQFVKSEDDNDDNKAPELSLQQVGTSHSMLAQEHASRLDCRCALCCTLCSVLFVVVIQIFFLCHKFCLDWFVISLDWFDIGCRS
jgi:hypothetical protein